MTAITPDYDSDPERRRSWTAPKDVHEVVAPELRGPVLDIASGEGRLGDLLPDDVFWVGVDDSPTQLAACTRRPVVRADMRALPFRDGAFAEAAHLWCLYHLDDPSLAIAEAARVLRAGGRYFASTSARDNDPEIRPEGYPASTFDAEEAADIVATTFPTVEADRWDAAFFSLDTREEARAYLRHNDIPPERADSVELPLWLTKRGVLVRATK
jgi:SAM-dependent methyltransferase